MRSPGNYRIRPKAGHHNKIKHSKLYCAILHCIIHCAALAIFLNLYLPKLTVKSTPNTHLPTYTMQGLCNRVQFQLQTLHNTYQALLPY